MENLFVFTRKPRYMRIDLKNEFYRFSKEIKNDKEEEKKVLERLRVLGYI